MPEVARYQDWDAFSLSDGECLIAEMAQRHPDEPGKWFQFAIVRSEDGQLLGDCGFACPKEDHRQAEIGITLCTEAQGHGYATEASACMLDYLFDNLRKHRVKAITDVRNAAAASMFLRLGFRREGQFLQNVWFKGEWADEFAFGLLRGEWEARPWAARNNSSPSESTWRGYWKKPTRRCDRVTSTWKIASGGIPGDGSLNQRIPKVGGDSSNMLLGPLENPFPALPRVEWLVADSQHTIREEINAVALFVGAIWAVFFISLAFPSIDNFGVIPRKVVGLVGIPAMPFLHHYA
jgi:RimJ/RimL family protein N-acetyltransferase